MEDKVVEKDERYSEGETEAYIKQLREEAKSHRLEKKEAEEQLSEALSRVGDLERQLKEINEKELEEEGELRKLVAQLREDKTALEQKLKDEARVRTRDRIAADVGLPTQMWGRVFGDTEEEMREDAEAILALIKPQEDEVAQEVQQDEGQKPEEEKITEEDHSAARATEAPGGQAPSMDELYREKFYGAGSGARSVFTPNPETGYVHYENG